MKELNIYYFSGTGNTKILVDEIANYFKKKYYEVHKHKIEKIKSEEVVKSGLICFAFPVAIHTTYPFVRKFIENIEFNKDMTIFGFTTLGGDYSGVPYYFHKLFKKKDCEYLGLEEFSTQNNFMQKSINNDKAKAKLEKAKEDIKTFSNKIMNREKIEYIKKPLTDMFVPLANQKWMWKLTQKSLGMKINQKKCISCGICVELCPVKNIVYVGDYPEIKNDCESCMRCFSFCPQQAIEINSKDEIKKYRAISLEEILQDEA
ncbi:MAG: EFR1 family ferrodoxin [Thermotogota bacterium]